MYLLDTNIVSHALNPQSKKHDAVRSFLESNALFNDQIFICAITIAETEFGLHLLKLRNPLPAVQRILEVERRVAEIAKMEPVLPINHHVAKCQAELRAAYANYKIPKIVAGNKGLKNRPVELWHEEVLPSKLQISENDLWIAAAALTYDLILVSVDRDHYDLHQAFSALHVQVV